MKKIYFIAIGGSAMHNLAIALHLGGNAVTGSDDEIFEPAKSRLAKYGLLPEKTGWDAERIDSSIDTIILGMHARADNPELLRAKELGLKIYSYPEYLYEASKNQKRVVIGGSHGKTTVTAMILHVLNGLGIDCNYMVGAPLEGFEVMVRLDPNANLMVIEGDEYLTSPIDLRPKFHLYHPHIGVINGIAWDHINVFPTFEIYVEQFDIFAQSIEKGGVLAYCKSDPEAEKIGENFASTRLDAKSVAYNTPEYKIIDGVTFVEGHPLKVFGKHNLQNMQAAWSVCQELGISREDFLCQIGKFKGASRRLELIEDKGQTAIYKDFAHSPSKLTATIHAVKEQYPDRKLVACMELHTFSSLNETFLDHYKACMDVADVAIVYFNPHALVHKNLPPITEEMVYNGFGRADLKVYSSSELLVKDLLAMSWDKANLLWMTSGDFDGIDEKGLAFRITSSIR